MQGCTGKCRYQSAEAAFTLPSDLSLCFLGFSSIACLQTSFEDRKDLVWYVAGGLFYTRLITRAGVFGKYPHRATIKRFGTVWVRPRKLGVPDAGSQPLESISSDNVNNYVVFNPYLSNCLKMGASRLCLYPTDVRRVAAFGRCSPGNDAFWGASFQTAFQRQVFCPTRTPCPKSQILPN